MRIFKYLLLFLPLLSFGQSNPFCGTFTPSGPIVRTGISNQRISGFIITGVSGQALMRLTNCHDIIIAVNIFQGNCLPGQDANRIGIVLDNCYNITIDTNRFLRVASGVQAVNCTGNLKINYNQFQNMTGPFPKGEAIQLNTCSGAGNQINFNNIENLPTTSLPEDCISIYKSNGILGSPIQVMGNQIRCGSNTSASGAGITLGDNGGNYQVARNNVMVNPGHCQLDIAGGMADTLVNNTCLTNDPTLINAVGIQAYAGPGSGGCINPVIIHNQIYCINSHGVQNPYYFPGSCVPLDTIANNWHAVLTPSILPTVLIPVCTVSAPVISYSPNHYTFYISAAITPVNVTSSGGAVASYSISPALPSGLIFNTATGQITGIPLALSTTTTYSIVGTNATGSYSTPLTLTVVAQAPVISYAPNSQVCTLGVAISIMTPITSGGGTPVSYSVTPSLPSGITINSSTGVIHGTGTALSPLTTYTIQAFNSGGIGTTTVTLSVVPPAPIVPNISFSPNTFSLPINVAIVPINPINIGGVSSSWGISPSLPAGLSFNTSTGSITGLPTALLSSTAFDVSATNISGTAHTTLHLAVINVVPPAPVISYTPNTIALTINQSAILLAPANTGGVSTNFSVSPALPAGVSLNTATGIISGVATALTPSTAYTISASNSGGTGTTPLTISVVPQGPGQTILVRGAFALFTP